MTTDQYAPWGTGRDYVTLLEYLQWKFSGVSKLAVDSRPYAPILFQDVPTTDHRAILEFYHVGHI
jgi:hypothetical protein